MKLLYLLDEINVFVEIIDIELLFIYSFFSMLPEKTQKQFDSFYINFVCKRITAYIVCNFDFVVRIAFIIYIEKLKKKYFDQLIEFVQSCTKKTFICIEDIFRFYLSQQIIKFQLIDR